jgi:hypothetical protein
MKYLVRSKGVPVLEVKYPESDDEARDFVNKIAGFLESLPKEKPETEKKAKDKESAEKEDKK